MTPRRALIGLLDRPGGRRLLARLATLDARRRVDGDVAIRWDGEWLHRTGDTYFLDGPRFTYDGNDLANFRERADRLFATLADYWFYLGRPSAGDVVVDVGAGIGLDSLLFARAVGSSGRVLAVEAVPGTYRRLDRLCRWNRLEQVTRVQKAVLDRDGEVTLDADADDHEANAVRPDAAAAPGSAEEPEGTRNSVTVAGTTLDRLCAEHGIDRVDLLKINIEGAEMAALTGARETLARTRRLCVACHDFRADDGDGEGFRSRDAVTELLRERGFEVTPRREEARPWVRDHLHARRPDDAGRDATGE